MKRLIIITLSIIIICAAINVIVANAKTYEDDVQTGNRTYIIKEYNGMVAGFEENSEEPFLVTEIEVKNLPPTDRKMLAGGVEVVGAKAFSRALEDYRS